MKRIWFPILGLLLLVSAGCLPPTQNQLRTDMDLEEMKRRLAKVEQGNAQILQGGGGPSRQQMETLSRQLAEQQSGLDTLRVDFQSINGRLDDLARDNQQRGDDFGLVRDDLGMQVSAMENRMAALEQELETLRNAAKQAPPATPTQVVSSTEGPELLYKQALDKIRNQQQYAAGRKQLGVFLKKYPKHDLNVNAMYWIGEALYGEKEYERAILQFQDVIQQYGDHPKAAAAMFKQALAFKSLGDNQNAKTTFQKLINSFPLAPEAGKAKQQIAKLS